MVPRNMNGEYLFPLNEMKDKYPEIYKEAIKKYLGRERIMERKIPYLNCKWNDCVHMTAAKPQQVINALLEANSPPRKRIKWYKIDPKTLDKSKLIVYLDPKKKSDDNIKEFKEYRIKDLKEYSKIPKETKTYYKNKFQSKEKPLLFHLIPHILHKRSINITKCEIIEV